MMNIMEKIDQTMVKNVTVGFDRERKSKTRTERSLKLTTSISSIRYWKSMVQGGCQPCDINHDIKVGNKPPEKREIEPERKCKVIRAKSHVDETGARWDPVAKRDSMWDCCVEADKSSIEVRSDIFCTFSPFSTPRLTTVKSSVQNSRAEGSILILSTPPLSQIFHITSGQIATQIVD